MIARVVHQRRAIVIRRNIALTFGAAVLAAIPFLPRVASAQVCAGFADVAANDPFCQTIEWVNNRQVTTGCGTGTTYCPDDFVMRNQMAAFTKRLGTALTPVRLSVDNVVAVGRTSTLA